MAKLVAGLSRDSAEYIENLFWLTRFDLGSCESADKVQVERRKKEAGYRLLELFCEAVRAGETPHPLASQHIADRITTIYYGINIDVKDGEKLIKTEQPGAGYFDLYGAGDEDQQANLKAAVARREWKTDPRTIFPKVTAKSAGLEHLCWAIEVERLKANGCTEVDAISKVAARIQKSDDSVKGAHQDYRRYAKYRANDPAGSE
jgi:hypothetical protein